MATTDQIRLELPAEPGYGRVARIAATHLARRRGFSTRELEDLRVVMDEAVHLLGTGGADTLLRVDYGGDATTMIVDVSLRGEGTPTVPGERVAHFGSVAGTLVDDYSVEPESARLTFTKSTDKRT